MRKLSGYGPSLIVLATAGLVLFAGPKAVQRLTYEQTKTRIIQARRNLENSGILEQLNSAYSDIAAVVEPSVVHISAHYVEVVGPSNREVLRLSTGSGWIYDDQGHVVTNFHVVQNAIRIDVQLYNGSIRPAEIVGVDPSTDIAVIKIEPGELHPATMAELSQPIKQGDLVFAFGSPFDFRFSMSSGVISGKDRSVGVIRDDAGRWSGYENFIQVDAAINPGNSGGPLTDYRGRVIGMNTAIATNRPQGLQAFEEGQFAGIGLAIPIDMILPVVSQIIETGFVAKGFMGVELRPLSGTIAERLKFGGTGAFVYSVNDDGPASRAGLLVNDIITHVADKPVSTVAQLRSVVSSMRPGDVAKLSIWRFDAERDAGQRMELSVGLTRLDMLRATGRIPVDQSRESIPPIGIARMSTSTPELAQILGVKYYPGVLIEELVEGSPLASALQPGSIIVSVADESVRDVDDFIEVLRTKDLSAIGGVRTNAFTPDGELTTVYLRLPVER